MAKEAEIAGDRLWDNDRVALRSHLPAFPINSERKP